MSRRIKPPKPKPQDNGAVWIRIEPNILGAGYTVSIEAHDDLSITLNPDRVMRYAMGILRATEYAEHDAAVAKQMHAVLTRNGGQDVPELVGQIIHDVRQDRPELRRLDTYPIYLEPGVNDRYEPFLTLFLGDDPMPAGQWDLRAAKEHALGAIQAVIAADLDATYQRVLTGVVGIEAPRALNIIDDLGNWRHHL